MKEYDIDYQLNSAVKGVDATHKTVKLADDSVVKYDKLLIATGGRARKPIMPGIDLEGVHTLRNSKDQEAIKSMASKTKNVVVIGGGFIGVETASHLKMKFKDDINVTLVYPEGAPFERVFGTEIGRAIEMLCVNNGVQVKREQLASGFYGKDGHVTSVKLQD